MKIKEIMRPVNFVSGKASIHEAAAIMKEKNVGSLVVEGGKGIVTERDILRKIVAEAKDPDTIVVSDIMTSPVVTIDAEKSVLEASELMGQKNIRRLLISSEDKILGKVTLKDVDKNLRYSFSKGFVAGGRKY